MPQEHTLTSRDRWFIRERRLDPLTKKEFSADDNIVICASCKAVSLRDSWEFMGGVCANCKGRERLTFPDFSRELFRPSASGNKNFKIVTRRLFPSVRLPAVELPFLRLPPVRLPAVALPAIRLPSVRLPAVLFSPFPSEKLCRRAYACSILLLLGICAFTYFPLSEISESDSIPETFAEAFAVRRKAYLDLTYERMSAKALQVTSGKPDAIQNRRSGVGETSETLPERTDILLQKLSALKGKADIPGEKFAALTDKFSSLTEALPGKWEQWEQWRQAEQWKQWEYWKRWGQAEKTEQWEQAQQTGQAQSWEQAQQTGQAQSWEQAQPWKQAENGADFFDFAALAGRIPGGEAA